MYEARIVEMKSIAISAFEPGMAEPEITLSCTSAQLQQLCDALLSDGIVTLTSEKGPRGRLHVWHDPSWVVPDTVLRYADSVEGHCAWVGDGFELEIRADPASFAELVDSIRTELLQNGGHLHRESYLVGGRQNTSWASFVFSLVE